MANIRVGCASCVNHMVSTKEITVIHELSRDDYFYRYNCPESKEPLINFVQLQKGIAQRFIGAHVKIENINVDFERQAEGMPDTRNLSPLSEDEINDFIIDLHIDEQTVLNALATHD